MTVTHGAQRDYLLDLLQQVSWVALWAILSAKRERLSVER